MPASAEGGTKGRRIALVVATGSYTDMTLGSLRAPGQDASDFAAVLGDQEIGGFRVDTVIDAPAESLRRRIAQFCADGAPGDLALMYLSCHGVLDDRGRLYYAAVDTDRALLSATAVSAAWLNEQFEDCRCRQQILVLDCCHSGAFAKGAKGDLGLALGGRFEGRGRIVLTGSRATEYSFEREEILGVSASSVFTSALVEGLRSGDADRDGDGAITIAELYDYAFEMVRASETRQTPTLWTYGAEGDLMVARSPRGALVKSEPAVTEPSRSVGTVSTRRPVSAGQTGSASSRFLGRRTIETVVVATGFAALATAVLLVTVHGGGTTSLRRGSHPDEVGATTRIARTGGKGAGKEPSKARPGGAGSPATIGSTRNAQLPSSTHPATSSSTTRGGWPQGFDGYTVALASDVIKSDAVGAVSTARSAGMRRVGFVWSSDYRSLRPGYWFVFSGIYTSVADARGHVAAAVKAGFSGAYVRHVAE